VQFEKTGILQFPDLLYKFMRIKIIGKIGNTKLLNILLQ